MSGALKPAEAICHNPFAKVRRHTAPHRVSFRMCHYCSVHRRIVSFVYRWKSAGIGLLQQPALRDGNGPTREGVHQRKLPQVNEDLLTVWL